MALAHTTFEAIEILPIRTEEDYNRTMEQIEALWGPGGHPAEGTPEADRLEVLITLVRAYEEQHHAIDPPDPIDAILFRMEQQGLVRKDLEPFIGTRARVSEVLNRRRPLSIGMIRKLHDGLGIPAEVLIRAG
jgi:HTH-type transcriptional regulator / antitoxin HigA